jgi:hypothetical protein
MRKQYLVPISFTAKVTVLVLANNADEAIDKATDEVWFNCGIGWRPPSPLWDAEAPKEKISVDSTELVSPPMLVE